MIDVIRRARLSAPDPAGLATSRELRGRPSTTSSSSAATALGHTWANLYDGLVLHTGKHLSALPGMPFPAVDAALSVAPRLSRLSAPVRRHVPGARRNERRRGQPRARQRRVDRADDNGPAIPRARGRHGDRNRVQPARAGDPAPRSFSRPGHPQRRLSASRRVRRSARARRRRSATRPEKSRWSWPPPARDVTVAVRSGARVVPREILGIPIQYFAVAMSPLPRKAQQAVQSAVGQDLGAGARGRAAAGRRRPVLECAVDRPSFRQCGTGGTRFT